jgi:HSP20 family molecular chaperone IbpA
VAIKASLPGECSKDLVLTIASDVHALPGEAQVEMDVEKAQSHTKEPCCGALARSISLPTVVAANKTDALFGHGSLTLTHPRAEGRKLLTITVRANPQDQFSQVLSGRMRRGPALVPCGSVTCGLECHQA